MTPLLAQEARLRPRTVRSRSFPMSKSGRACGAPAEMCFCFRVARRAVFRGPATAVVRRVDDDGFDAVVRKTGKDAENVAPVQEARQSGTSFGYGVGGREFGTGLCARTGSHFAVVFSMFVRDPAAGPHAVAPVRDHRSLVVGAAVAVAQGSLWPARDPLRTARTGRHGACALGSVIIRVVLPLSVVTMASRNLPSAARRRLRPCASQHR